MLPHSVNFPFAFSGAPWILDLVCFSYQFISLTWINSFVCGLKYQSHDYKCIQLLNGILSWYPISQSVSQFSHSVMSDSLWPHESQYTRPPCPSPTPGVYSNSWPSSWWCHPAISSSTVPFSSCPESLPHWKRVFSNESTLRVRWQKYWSFSFSISPSNEQPGLISFRMDCLDLLAVQGTLKSLLQQHSSKTSIFQRSAFFTVQLSHPYMTTGKTIAWPDGPLLAK